MTQKTETADTGWKPYTIYSMHSQFIAKVSAENLNLLGRKRSWMHFLVQLSKGKRDCRIHQKEFLVNISVLYIQIHLNVRIQDPRQFWLHILKKDQQSEHQGDEEVITKRRTKEEGFTYNQKLDRIDTSIIHNYLHYQCRLFWRITCPSLGSKTSRYNPKRN